MPSVFVTGAAGVVGRAVCRQLAARGMRVVAHDLPGRAPGGECPPGIDWVNGDVLDWAAFSAALAAARPDYVIHLAAVVASRANADPRAAVHVNVSGAANVCEAACAQGCRGLVYVSSRSVYGNVDACYAHPHYEPVPETHACRPEAFYPTTKRAAEMIIERYAALRGLPAVMLRFGAIYGPGKSADHGATRAFSEAIEAAAAGQDCALGGADQREDFVYSEDIPHAIVTAIDYLQRGDGRGAAHVFNIGSGRGVAISEFADVVRAMAGRGPALLPGTGVMGRDTRQSFVMSDERARSVLGYRPKFDLESGIAHYVSRLRTANER